ncbi:MAG: M20/M25/M40 family metallo-hydrolase [bacterium]|nr:M20/M25/M40 family metallo-hydrolase [bacterium]
MERRTITLLIALVALSTWACDTSRGLQSITEDRMRRHVEFLADDALLGRDTGESGIGEAEEYIAAFFGDAGLSPPPGCDDHFIDFELHRSAYDAAGTSLAITADGVEHRAELGSDFRPFDFSDEGRVEAQVVFAGYGITADEHDYDDFAGLDVEGKIVLVLRHEPGENDPDSAFDGTSSSRHALFTAKAERAAENGALGMILVTDPLHHEEAEDLRVRGSLRLDPPEPAEDEETVESPFLALQVDRALADLLARPSGVGLDELQRRVDDGTAPGSIDWEPVTVRLAVRTLEGSETVRARNVAGFVAGSDPALTHEWLVVGGHHDHVGGFPGEGDTVFNGADDNASGVSAVLELARAFASAGERPRRSILFVTFSAEERGLLGSRALVEQALVPVEQIVFMLNLDMIGRNPERAVEVYGDGYVRELREIVDAANEPLGIPLQFNGSGYAGNSDHDAFFDSDVPFTFFFTGTHEDYHQLGDHPEKLDFSRMQSIARLAHGVIDRVANADRAPTFVHNVTWLGIRVEVDDAAAPPAARITGVEEASRAEQAGLLAGDVLLAFDDEALEHPDDVGPRFREIDPGPLVALSVSRDGDELRVEVERARTGYLGVFPGAVDDDQRTAHGLNEGQGIVLLRVVAGGPAEAAGLLEGDIMISIEGRPVGTNSLRSRLMQIGAGETVDVALIRDDDRISLPLELGERPSR